MNVKNILCPVDFSESSEAAVRFAESLAKDHRAELHIVYVYENAGNFEDGGFAASFAKFRDDSKERLLTIVPKSEDVNYRHVFLEGLPCTTLLEYVEENDIDLIVMGTHGRTGVMRLLMGSVAETVVRKAPCPVLTIKSPDKTAVAVTTEDAAAQS